MTNTVKFATINDVDLIEKIYRANPRVSSKNIKPLTDEEIAISIRGYIDRIREGSAVVPILLDETGEPLAFYVGYYIKGVGGWFIHGPRIKNIQTSYFQTAKLCAPLLDALIEHMESRMYFKFWQVDIGSRHLTRRDIMVRYSNKLSQYDYLDEIYIPAGNKTEIIGFDSFAQTFVFNSDRMIRMYVLKQEHRGPLLKGYYERNKK